MNFSDLNGKIPFFNEIGKKKQNRKECWELSG